MGRGWCRTCAWSCTSPRTADKLADDPGASSPTQGYVGHYCNVPRRDDPGIVACSSINSGLRVFDITNPRPPVEIAYFVPPLKPGDSSYAMSSPAFVPERNEIWYSDANSGFYSLRLTNGVWPKVSGAQPAGGVATSTTTVLPATQGVPRHIRTNAPRNWGSAAGGARDRRVWRRSVGVAAPPAGPEVTAAAEV